MIRIQDMKKNTLLVFLFWVLLATSAFVEENTPIASSELYYPLSLMFFTGLMFAWFIADAREYGFNVSNKLKFWVAVSGVFAVTYYLIRYKGWKGFALSFSKFIVIFAVFFVHIFLSSPSISGPRQSPFLEEPLPSDISLREMKTLAENGSVFYQTNLGWMYYVGDEVERDYKKAIYWTKMAAEQRFHYALNNLAVFYDEGKAFKEDDKKAHELYLEAANLGLDRAQSNVAENYYNGVVVEQDYVRAFDWFLKAATQGYDTSKYFVARMYIEGKGIERSPVNAMKWAYRIDYDELRTTYVNSTFYDPTELELEAKFARIFSSMDSSNSFEALQYVKEILDRDNLNPLALTVAMSVSRDMDDVSAETFYAYLYGETMKSIIDNGNGISVNSAYKVVSKGEQTALLRMLGYEYLESRVFMEDGKVINAWRVNGVGEDKAVFFDISYFLQARDMEGVMASSSI